MAALGRKTVLQLNTLRILRNSCIDRGFSSSSAIWSSKVGFVGLGNMGGHMARNLLKKGHRLVVFDLSKDALQSVKEAGAEVASTPAEVAGQVTKLVSMLPESSHVQEVYTGANGIFSAVQKGSLLIDCSTIDPSVSQAMADLAAEKGAEFVDAPVSGGVNAARDAILTFMVGGPETSFTSAEKYLSCMGKNVVHCGPVGTGQPMHLHVQFRSPKHKPQIAITASVKAAIPNVAAMNRATAKICNNMLLGISMIGTSETMNLGIKLGLDAKLLAKILNMSSGRCWSSELYNPCPGVLPGVPSSNEYKGGFGTALMTKDLGLAQNAATGNKCPTPMGSLAHQIYRTMTNHGFGGKDFSSAFKFLQDQEK